MKIAIEGCCHGELDSIYEALRVYENRNSTKLDLLIICGDFQAVRNRTDLKAMAVPQKYREMKTFYKYYSGECTAPILTIFVGGNHEASNYLQELPYGGWVAKNIYYMGYANVIQFGGIRIAGISGIYKKYNFNFGHHERPPYNEFDIKSVYHMRNLEVFRLKQIRQPIDIFISHDWPRGIFNYGDANGLLRYKKHFRQEMESGTLGNPATEELLFTIKPTHWFAAHMHCRFQAVVQHQMTDGSTKFTNFLALDKCLPNRKFLEIIDVESKNCNQELKLHLDPEWLSILKLTNHFFSLSKSIIYLPVVNENPQYCATSESLQTIHEDFMGNFVIPDNFLKTASVHSNAAYDSVMVPLLNPQTQLLTSMLDIVDPFALVLGQPNKLMARRTDAIFSPGNSLCNPGNSVSSKNSASEDLNSCSFNSPRILGNSLIGDSFNNSDFINSTINSSVNISANKTQDSLTNDSINRYDVSVDPNEINLQDSDDEELNEPIIKTKELLNSNDADNLLKNMRQKLSHDLRVSMITSSPANPKNDSKVFRVENLEREWINSARKDQSGSDNLKVATNLVNDSAFMETGFENLDEEELAFLGPDAKKLSLSPIVAYSTPKIVTNRCSALEGQVEASDGPQVELNVENSSLVGESEKLDASVNSSSQPRSLKRRNLNIYATE